MEFRRVRAIGISVLILFGGCRAEVYKPCQERPQDVRIRLETSRTVSLLDSGYHFPPTVYITQPDGTTWELRVPTNRPRDWGLWRHDPSSPDGVPVDFRLSDEPPRRLKDVSPTIEPASTHPSDPVPQDSPARDGTG
jgi:hypothetical protein